MRRLKRPKVLAVALDGKVLVWRTDEATARRLIGELRAGADWNAAWRGLLGEAYAATNSADRRVADKAERLVRRCDYFVDLDNLKETLAEID